MSRVFFVRWRRALRRRRPWLWAALALAGCSDPVRQAAIEALGPEDPRVAPGPLHRPGQPCLVCHGEGGGATPMSAAGTVYRMAGDATPAAGAEVTLRDAARTAVVAEVNCAGNFYVYARRFAPTLPLWASVRLGDESIAMESPLHRDGDCASCHGEPAGPASAGPIFVADDARAAAGLPRAVCP